MIHLRAFTVHVFAFIVHVLGLRIRVLGFTVHLRGFTVHALAFALLLAVSMQLNALLTPTLPMNLTLVGTSRCDVPAREIAGGIIVPLHAARTAQRADICLAECARPRAQKRSKQTWRKPISARQNFRSLLRPRRAALRLN